MKLRRLLRPAPRLQVLRRRAWKCAAVGACATAAACGSSQSPPAGPSLVYGEDVRRDVGNGLTQHLRFASAEVRAGDTLRIRSVVVNDGAVPADVASRACGIDVAGELQLDAVGAWCGAYSQRVRLAPGDSVAVSGAWVVRAVPPGSGATAVVRVRQLLDPEVTIQAYVRVLR